MHYQLTRALSCCLVEEHWIFLDCAADRYFALPAVDKRSGVPDLAHPALKSRISPESRADALTPVTTVHPKLRLEAGRGPRHLKSCLSSYIFLFRAFLRRSGHFAKLEAVATQARNHVQGIEPRISLEMAVRSFEAVMRWFPVQSQCLPQALALQEFLLSTGHQAMVVVGVSTNPFKAHCWVQMNDQVLLQAPEFVRGYHPIRVFQ